MTSLGVDYFTADVMPETFNKKFSGRIKAGSPVNLERAMPAAGRFGGHLVSGHIDGTGTITAIRQDDMAVRYTVEADRKLLRYVVEKGSVTIDGISLTVVHVDAETFQVSVIPHTQKVTTLHGKRPGSKVNLECDIIGKYVEKLLQPYSSEAEEPLPDGLTESLSSKLRFLTTERKG